MRRALAAVLQQQGVLGTGYRGFAAAAQTAHQVRHRGYV